MSMFPSVGSTVTRVAVNKTGTIAKVEFDDGTSLLVKYEALVIDEPSNDQIPVQKESKVLLSGGANIVPKVKTNKVTKPVAAKPVMSESAYKELAAQALKRQSNRQDKVFKQWESDTGQFDHNAGPVT